MQLIMKTIIFPATCIHMPLSSEDVQKLEKKKKKPRMTYFYTKINFNPFYPDYDSGRSSPFYPVYDYSRSFRMLQPGVYFELSVCRWL